VVIVSQVGEVEGLSLSEIRRSTASTSFGEEGGTSKYLQPADIRPMIILSDAGTSACKKPDNPLAIEVHVGLFRMLFADSLLRQLPREKAYLPRQPQTRRSAHHSETVACLRLPPECLTAHRDFG
jgi:hypothetical protein